MILFLAPPIAAAQGPQQNYLAGVVTDSDGRPLPDALIQSSGLNSKAEIVRYQTRSDAQGKYRLEMTPAEFADFQMFLFVHKPGYALRPICLPLQRLRLDHPEMPKLKLDLQNLTLQLERAEPFKVFVQDVTGKPLASAEVFVQGFGVNNLFSPHQRDSGTIVPKGFMGIAPVKTDAQGMATIHYAKRSQVERIQVDSPTDGSQLFPASPGELRLRLQPTGSITGHIHAAQPGLYQGTKVTVHTWSVGGLDPANPFGNMVNGVAQVELDSEGRFHVPALTSGRIQVRIDWPKQVPVYRLKLPKDTILKPEEHVHIESEDQPLEMINIEGRVLLADTRQPVAGAELTWDDPQDTYETRVVTDAEGWYRCTVFKGDLRGNFRNLGHDPEVMVRYEFPKPIQIQIGLDQTSPYKLEDIQLQKTPDRAQP